MSNSINLGLFSIIGMIGAVAIIQAIVIGGLIRHISKSEKEHKEERKDLYNRVMAKDLNEYSSAANGRKPGGANMINSKVVNDLKENGFIE